MKQDRIIGILLILFSAFMYSQTRDFPAAVFGTKGAGFFPNILFTLLALAGGALTLQGWTKKRKGKKEKEDGQKGSGLESWKKFKASLRTHSYVIISFIFTFGYIVALHYFGYLISTLAFMLTLMWFLAPRGRKRIPLIIVISCAMTFLIYLSFEKLLLMFLPEGSLF